MFEQAKWIWSAKAEGADSYSEFLVTRECKKDDTVKLRISADSNYAVYVNGVFVDSGQYADMPHYKVYDEVDLSQHIVDGENHIAFVVWHYGVVAFTYFIGKPGVIFEIEQNGQVVVSSDKTVLSRKSKRYISGKSEAITWMLGLNYHVDLKESDDWMVGKDMEGFEESTEPEDMPTNLVARIAKKLDVYPITSGEIVMQGSFTYPTDTYLTQHAGDRMQNSSLAFFRLHEMADREEKPLTMVRKTGEGIFFIIDMGKESTGYLEFDLEVPQDCEMEVGWGEHLADGRCRSAVGPRAESGATVRNFSVTAKLQKGRNHYMNPFRRLGCRYIQFFIKSDEVKVNDAGLRLTLYPVTPKQFKTGDRLRDAIYEMCQHTLLQCMHEHYEDCTWREQSLYTGDSRNQMLAGYYTFGEYDLPKATLRLIAECVREDGMQPICFPSNVTLTIPGGMPIFARMIIEYYEHSKDAETVAYCYPAIKRTLDAFVERMDDTGLIPNFDEAKDFWNFCEWQPYLDGDYYRDCGVPHDRIYDTCLNGGLSEALRFLAQMCDIIGEDGESYRQISDSINKKIAELLYDREAKLFKVAIGPGIDIKPYAAVANMIAYRCGAAKYVDNAKFVPAQILSVKAQNHSNTAAGAGSTKTRLISSVDSYEYKEVGFEVVDMSGETDRVITDAPLNVVYSSLVVSAAAGTKKLTPEVVYGDIEGAAAQKFIVLSLNDIPEEYWDADIYVRPYWTTFDGVRVSGLAKYVYVADGLNGWISVPVNLHAGAQVTAGIVGVSVPDGLEYKECRNGKVFDEVKAAANGNVVKFVGNTSEVKNVAAEDMLAVFRFKVTGDWRVGNGTQLDFTVSDLGFANAAEQYVDVNLLNVKY